MKKTILTSLLMTYTVYASGFTPIISPACAYNAPVSYLSYTSTSEANQNFYNDVSRRNLFSNPNIALKPIWDSRSQNTMSSLSQGGGQDAEIYTGLNSKYGKQNSAYGTNASEQDPSGSIMQSKCVNGELAGGTIINLWDAPTVSIKDGGIANTFGYMLDNASVYPWKSNGIGNIMIQAAFNMPVYNVSNNNEGGNVNFNLYMYNESANQHLNYIITIFGYRNGYNINNNGPQRIDSQTNIMFVSSNIKSNLNKYVTPSRYSNETMKVSGSAHITNSNSDNWPYFFRTNISYRNLQNTLNEINAHRSRENRLDNNPAHWKVTYASIQYEIEEGGSHAANKKASIAGSFTSFGVYSSDYPE